VGHRLSEEERQRIMLSCNQLEYAPPWQIVPALADQKLFYSCGEDFVYGSESSFYRVLHQAVRIAAMILKSYESRGWAMTPARAPSSPRSGPRCAVQCHEANWTCITASASLGKESV